VLYLLGLPKACGLLRYQRRWVVYVNRAANSDWLKTGGMISP
jgi:hypothetical protein